MEAYTHIYGKWVGKGGQDEHRMGCILNKNSRWDHGLSVDLGGDDEHTHVYEKWAKNGMKMNKE